MASASGKGNDGGVTMEQLKELEYELRRNRTIEENEKRLAWYAKKVHFCRNISKMRNGWQKKDNLPKRKAKKGPSNAPVSTIEGRVLRSSARKYCDHVDQQPSNELTPELNDAGEKKKCGRKIPQKADVYARLNQPKIHIPLNELVQPIGPKATEFTNFIVTLVRKHITPGEIDWRDVDEEKKLIVWKNLKAFYEDITALRFVINTSHTKWKEWKADLKKSRFDVELTDEQLMERHY